jgi:hypothetical protein
MLFMVLHVIHVVLCCAFWRLICWAVWGTKHNKHLCLRDPQSCRWWPTIPTAVMEQQVTAAAIG